MACPTVAGTASQGTYIRIGNCASPETFNDYIPGMMDITGPEESLGEIETTNHGTPSNPQTGRTYRPSLADFGTISCKLIWDQSNSVHRLLKTMLRNKQVRNMQLLTTDPSDNGQSFQGFVQKLGQSYTVAGINMRDLVIRVTSPLTDL